MKGDQNEYDDEMNSMQGDNAANAKQNSEEDDMQFNEQPKEV